MEISVEVWDSDSANLVNWFDSHWEAMNFTLQCAEDGWPVTDLVIVEKDHGSHINRVSHGVAASEAA